MRKMIIFATSYPYAAGIIAIIWLGSVILIGLGGSLPLGPVLFINVIVTLVVAIIGFRR